MELKFPADDIIILLIGVKAGFVMKNESLPDYG